MQICPTKKKECWSRVTPMLLKGSKVCAGAKGGTPLGFAGLMGQGQFDQGGGLMVW